MAFSIVLGASALLAALPCAGRAQAQDDRAEHGHADAADGAAAGMFLPVTEAPRTDTQRAFASALGGYEMPRQLCQMVLDLVALI